jgi:hypothetical protein
MGSVWRLGFAALSCHHHSGNITFLRLVVYSYAALLTPVACLLLLKKIT